MKIAVENLYELGVRIKFLEHVREVASSRAGSCQLVGQRHIRQTRD